MPPILQPLTLLGPPRKTLSGKAVFPEGESGTEMVKREAME